MKRNRFNLSRAILAGLLLAAAMVAQGWARARPEGYAGSRSCISCHERFYKLWSASFHGLAMQPYSPALASAKLTAHQDDIVIGDYRYRAHVSGDEGWIEETGAGGRKRYPIAHVLGGKNVYYFLTPLEKGRLQTLPLAYDVHRKEWYDMAASGVRHFPGGRQDAPVGWKDWPYTFNTACRGCHVSQLASHYDLDSDSYTTRWREPGINCETCHGPSEAHNRLFASLSPGALPPDKPQIISAKTFSATQHNETCSGCHAKASALTAAYPPGARFFDHFDLVTLENPDFYPDGRDLGENYTYTSWLMSPCARKSDLNCLTCHTSSGRYRFKEPQKANGACLPCHQQHVANPSAHTHHPADSPGSQCTACHMPMTEFARMRRSDHSMRPPAPAATVAFGSPNACNGCHADRSPQWADRWVRQWRTRDYQAPILAQGRLIQAARQRDWTHLEAMLAAIGRENRDEIVATSLIRLLRACDDPRVTPVLLAAMDDPSPLIRSSAAESLGTVPSPATVQALAKAARDPFRLVRIRAAQSLAGFGEFSAGQKIARAIKDATLEYLASLTARPDLWTAHYNLGTYHLVIEDYASAAAAYGTAIRLAPREVPPRVNLAIAQSRQGDTAGAEASLHQALDLEPDNPEANFNMGLLQAERRQPQAAENHLRTALLSDPQMAPAAYNLCVMLGSQGKGEAIDFCRQAAKLRPYDERYAWTLAYYQNRLGDPRSAAVTLEELVRTRPSLLDGYLLLADIYVQMGQPERAKDSYRRALTNAAKTPSDRAQLTSLRRRIEAYGLPSSPN